MHAWSTHGHLGMRLANVMLTKYVNPSTCLFHNLQPMIVKNNTSRNIYKRMQSSKGRVYKACFRSVMLYGTVVKLGQWKRLEHNDVRMIRWMCNDILKDRKPSELREHLGLDSIRNCIGRGWLKWFVHVERYSDDSVVKKWRDIVVEGQQRKGRTWKAWYQVVQ